jgi:C4-dicarboxylate-specific signal transduction histidine kinase
MGDPVQLQQALMNLMINGIDAMNNVDRTGAGDRVAASGTRTTVAFGQ